jgi:hypothetical protein
MRSGLFDYTSAPDTAPFFDNAPTKVWTLQELLAISFARAQLPEGHGLGVQQHQLRAARRAAASQHERGDSATEEEP